MVTRAITWRLATVVELRSETPNARTLQLDVPGWPGHQAGQHVDVRLTAEDGYQAQRSYSIASPPDATHLALTVERLEDGEVSSYLCGELRVGDSIELRGPIGGYFVWDDASTAPLMLIGGGSGIVPLMAMLRHREAFSPQRRSPARLLYSSRRWDEVIYREELAGMVARDATLAVSHTITRQPRAGWTGYRRRIDRAMLAEVAWPAAERPQIFICGPTPLVELVASTAVELGHDPKLVKTERFGPTGQTT